MCAEQHDLVRCLVRVDANSLGDHRGDLLAPGVQVSQRHHILAAGLVGDRHHVICMPPHVNPIPQAQDKVLIWLNGLLIGRYWEAVGPQHVVYLAAGLLREHGRNTLALAVWNRGHRGGLTGGVSLQPYAVNTQVTLRIDS